MPVYTINKKQFLLGASSGEYADDGGFSPSSTALNLTKERGVLYFAPAATNRGGATLTGNIIASALPEGGLTNDGYFLDDEGAFYTLLGTTFTKRQTVTADTFVSGKTEMMTFAGATYATSQSRVVQLTGSDLTAVDSSWWTGLNSSYPHPMERVESELYIGDVNSIHVWDGATSTASAVTLPTSVSVTSLRKHSDGRTLLAFCQKAVDQPHTKGNTGVVYYVDTVLKDWTREVEISSRVDGTRLVNGVIYTTYGKNFGYFDGSGLQLIRRFPTSGATYSHMLGNMEDIVLTRDGRRVWAYGNLGKGNVWWPIYYNADTTDAISCVHYKGDNVLCVAHDDGGTAGLLYELDYDNAGTGTFYTDRIDFGSDVKVKRIDIVHDETDTAGTSTFSISSVDAGDTNNTNLVERKVYTSQQVYKSRINCNFDAEILQLALLNDNDALGFKSIRIYYDPI